MGQTAPGKSDTSRRTKCRSFFGKLENWGQENWGQYTINLYL